MNYQKENPIVGTRLKPEIKEALTGLARAKNQTLSAYLRDLISEAVKGVNAAEHIE